MGRKHEIDTLHRLRDSLAYRMGLALKQLHVGLTAAIEERLRADGMDLTRPQAITLMLLAERPGVSNAELARLGGVSPQTMHQILLRLARDGLVTHPAPHADTHAVVRDHGRRTGPGDPRRGDWRRR